jgi:hypothetical protein
LAADDRVRAVAMVNFHMRVSHERSADAWGARAELLDSLETSFNERLAAKRGSPAPAR